MMKLIEPLLNPPRKIDELPFSAWKFVLGTANQNKLANIVGVYSDSPLETVRAYLKHVGQPIIEEPKRVDKLGPNFGRYDFLLAQRSDAPFYAIKNKIRLTWYDGGIA